MLYRVVCASAFVLFVATASAQPLPSDGNVVPPHSGASGNQGQSDTPPAPQSPYVDEGNGGGNTSLPSDGNVVPPHAGGGSDDSAGNDAPSGSSSGDTPSNGGSQLPSDGNVVPRGDSSSGADQPSTPAGDDKSI